MIFVIAGDYSQYKMFLQMNKLRDNQDAKPVLRDTDLFGHLWVEIVFTGTWFDRRKDMTDIWRRLDLLEWTDVSGKFFTS